MSGLILGGIGKGLSDAGETFGKFMLADIADKRQAAREDAYATRQERSLEAAAERQSARDSALAERQSAAADAAAARQAAAAIAAQEKAEALERLRAKLAEDKLEEKRIRANQDFAKIETIGNEKLAAWEKAELAQAGPQLNADTARLAELSKASKGKGPGASPETFAQLIKENPEYRKVYRDAGYISDVDPNQKALARLDAESKAAIEIGADQNIINYYKDIRAQVLAQIKEQNRLPIEQQKADAATANANRPRGNGRGSSTAKAPTPAQIATAERSLDSAIKIAEKNFRPPSILEKNNPAKMAAYEKEKAAAINRNPDVASRRRAVEELRGGSSRPSSTALGGNNQRPPLDSFRR